MHCAPTFSRDVRSTQKYETHPVSDRLLTEAKIYAYIYSLVEIPSKVARKE